jgi:hypothetical protein
MGDHSLDPGLGLFSGLNVLPDCAQSRSIGSLQTLATSRDRRGIVPGSPEALVEGHSGQGLIRRGAEWAVEAAAPAEPDGKAAVARNGAHRRLFHRLSEDWKRNGLPQRLGNRLAFPQLPKRLPPGAPRRDWLRATRAQRKAAVRGFRSMPRSPYARQGITPRRPTFPGCRELASSGS